MDKQIASKNNKEISRQARDGLIFGFTNLLRIIFKKSKKLLKTTMPHFRNKT